MKDNIFNFVTIKPKLFWLILLIAAVAVMLGAIALVVVLFSGSTKIQILAVNCLSFLWGAGFLLTIIYFVRQALGKYVAISERPLRDQIW